MKLEDTFYSNYKIVLDEFNIPVALQLDGHTVFQLYDYVQVSGDSCGYVAIGIKKPGLGTIMRIRNNRSGYFLGVFMDDGDFGYVKVSKLRKLSL